MTFTHYDEGKQSYSSKMYYNMIHVDERAMRERNDEENKLKKINEEDNSETFF